MELFELADAEKRREMEIATERIRQTATRRFLTISLRELAARIEKMRRKGRGIASEICKKESASQRRSGNH